MSQPVCFSTLFAALGDVAPPLWNGIVTQINHHTNDNALAVAVSVADFLLPQEIVQAKQNLCTTYGLRDATLAVSYDLAAMGERVAPFLQQAFAQKHPSAAAALRAAQFSFDPHKPALHIAPAEPWQRQRLEELSQAFGSLAKALLGTPIAIEVQQEQDAHDAEEDYETRRKRELKKLTEDFAAQPRPQAPTPEAAPKRTFTKKRDPNAVRFSPQGRQDDVLWGKPSAREMHKLVDVSLDSGRVTVAGQIFFQEKRKLNGKDKTIVTFDLSDGTGSIRVLKILPDDEAADLLGKTKPGQWVLVQGVVHYSTYDKDIQLNPSAIVKEKAPVVTDDAPTKRVELHLHTNMSAMDGLCNTGKALSFAADMGHTALAITDHGVAQAYPDAMQAASKLKKQGKEIKVLYGLEAYCVNDLGKQTVVKGQTDTPLRGEIVVFDLETTGLSPLNC